MTTGNKGKLFIRFVPYLVSPSKTVCSLRNCGKKKLKMLSLEHKDDFCENNDLTSERQLWKVTGCFPFDQEFREFRVGECNRNFREFHFEILGEVRLKFRKFGKNQKIPFHSTIYARAQSPRDWKSNSTWLMLKHLNIISMLHQTNNWNILLQHYCSGLASTSFSE